MKIKQDANGRLIVKHDLALFGFAFLIGFGTAAAISVVNAQWTFALIMTAVTLFSLILLSVRSTCAFDRAHGMVVLVRRSIFGTKIEEIQFGVSIARGKHPIRRRYVSCDPRAQDRKNRTADRLFYQQLHRRESDG